MQRSTSLFLFSAGALALTIVCAVFSFEAGLLADEAAVPGSVSAPVLGAGIAALGAAVFLVVRGLAFYATERVEDRRAVHASWTSAP
ncbi:hypothetical protein [Microbacterium sp. gxy059]|uniref:Wt8.10 n=1 Tax=uncultured bacterium WT8 TaxID=1393214 RepID=U3Q629_9BACT|nr:Wt8.10 [uncultured bacterium WT8]